MKEHQNQKSTRTRLGWYLSNKHFHITTLHKYTFFICMAFIFSVGIWCLGGGKSTKNLYKYIFLIELILIKIDIYI